MNRSSARTLLVLAAPGLLGAVVVMFATRWGMGLTPDSASYVAAAGSLAAGKGVSAPDFQTVSWAPMTHWPPLYPAVLAGFGLVGIGPLVAARWLGALLLGADCVLVALLVCRRSGQARWLGMLAGLAVAGSPNLVDVHLMVWTEPLFIFLTLLGLLLLSRYLEGGRTWLLVAAAGAAAMALLTRYLGVALIAAAGLCLLLLPGRKWTRRVPDCVLWGIVSCAPPGLWVLRNKLVAGSAANRALAFHPVGAEELRSALLVISRWFLPESLPQSVRLGLVAAALVGAPVLAILTARRAGGATNGQEGVRSLQRAPAVLTVFLAAYLAMLLVSICFIDALTPLDNRILSPLNPVLVVLALAGAWGLARGLGRVPAVSLAAVVILAGFVAWTVHKGLSQARARQDSEGFATRPWAESATMATVRGLPGDRPVYSNCPEAIYLLTDRLAYLIPPEASPYTQVANELYRDEVERMARDLAAHKGLLLYLRDTGRWYLPTEEDLTHELPRLMVIQEDAEGKVYVMPQEP